MKLTFFPKYSAKGPSSRYRFYHFVPMFKKNGFEIKTYPLLDDEYLNTISKNESYSKFKYIKLFFNRIILVFKLSKNDIVFVQHEFFPFVPAFFEWYLTSIVGVKYVLDYDDAVFHNYDTHPNLIIRFLFKKKIPYVMKKASYIITGSPYLTRFAAKYNDNVIEIPTCIDIEKYKTKVKTYGESSDDYLTIGWIGSKTTSVNILEIIPALKRFNSEYKMKLNLIGFDENLLNQFKGLNYQIIDWSSNTEVENIKKFDVGIMPLIFNPFINGKCGFKLIQYMACGIPTISTPYEANVKINRSMNNLHATTNDDWYNAFKKIFENRKFYKDVGLENIKIVENYYTIQVNENCYIDTFKTLIN
jgi:glycosyltransferase involved in cell wall biosynthesis